MKFIASWATAAVLVLAATPAPAAIMQATYTGVIYAGTDFEGVFAPAGANLTGDAFTYNFVYDTAIGTQVPAQGGTTLVPGSSAPVLASTLTILGQTISPSGLNGFYSIAAQVVPDYGDPSLHYKASACHASGAVAGSWFSVCINTNDPVPGDLETPFSVTAASPYPGPADVSLPGGPGPYHSYLLYGSPQTLVVSRLGDSPGPVDAVPEPAAWGLMLLGFGGVGATLRRRRASPALA